MTTATVGFWRRSSTIVALVGAVLVMGQAVEPSATKHIFLYSYLRLTIIAAIAGSIVYLLLSLRSVRLQTVNNYVAYAIVTNLFLIEIFFHVFPSLVPIEILPMLPRGGRDRVASARGLFTSETFRGDGLLYSFAATNAELKSSPWVVLDADGYRNTSAPGRELEIVTFGDSVIFATQARKDLAEQFREAGHAAYSLAMGAYGPFQYRDAYRKYVIEPGHRHRLAIVFVSLENDFAEASKYVRVELQGGDFRDYLGTTSAGGPIWADRQPSWVASIVVRFPTLAKHLATKFRRRVDPLIGESLDVVLPYARYRTNTQLLYLHPIEAQSPDWRNFTRAMDEFVDMATVSGAIVVFAIMPNPALLYREFVSGHNARKTLLENRYRTILRLLNGRYRPRGVHVINLVEPISRNVKVKNIFTSPLDYHLNTAGMKMLFDDLNAALIKRGLITPKMK